MKSSTKFILSAVALASAAFAQSSYADEGVAYNVGVMSEYRYRGLGQTRGKPALQGGIDYDSGKGYYLGVWGSTIKWIKDNSTATQGVDGGVEIDLYGGYKFDLGGDTLDVGFLRYQYQGNTLYNTDWGGAKTTYKNANTNEIYAAYTVGVVTAKLSYALSNLFGQYNFTENQSSKGSTYVDLSANLDIGNGYTLVPHVGHQKIQKITGASYTDYALTLNKDLGKGLSASLGAVGTNAKEDYWMYTTGTEGEGYFPGRTRFVAGLKYTF